MTGTAERSSSAQDFRWAVWIGSLPTIFGAAMVLSMLVAGTLGVTPPGAVANWWLFGVFGLAVFLPVAVVAWTGAVALGSHYKVGRWAVTIASASATVVSAMMVYGMFELLARPELRGQESWVSAPTAGGAVLFAVPYVAICAANAYLVTRLWRRC